MSQARTEVTSVLGSAAIVYAVAVAVNYPWELAESPLYEGTGDSSRMWWHCFVASLGDGLLVLLILGAGFVAFGRARWFVAPGAGGYALMVAVGLAVAVAVEWIALHPLRRWSYTPRMPVVPGLGVGLLPVLQMLVLPPLVFRVAGCLSNRVSQGEQQ